MCLITTQKEAKIAETDMIVYKLLLEGMRSPYELFKYVPGQLYEATIQDSREWRCADDTDMNYLDKNYAGWRFQYRSEELRCIGEGFHSYATKARSLVRDEYYLYECTIPAGSEYFEDATGLVVSNKIIINGLTASKNS